MERKSLEQLPQFYADRFGWKEMTSKIAKVYHALPETEQANACIMASNYGEAGAIEYYGKDYDLPLPPVSGHNQYHVWGAGRFTGNIVIAVGFSEKYLSSNFQDIQPVEQLVNPYMMPYKRSSPIYVCRQPVIRFQELNPWLKWLN